MLVLGADQRVSCGIWCGGPLLPHPRRAAMMPIRPPGRHELASGAYDAVIRRQYRLPG